MHKIKCVVCQREFTTDFPEQDCCSDICFDIQMQEAIKWEEEQGESNEQA